MSEHDGPWAEGTPSWVDIQVGDLPGAREFYSRLFGWELAELPEAGGYTMATRGVRPIAGIGPRMVANAPIFWATYIATDSVDESLARVTANGGTVVFEPMDVMTAGRMAVATDPFGAVFGLWQGHDHLGAGIVNEPGALTWNELRTGDYAGSKDFYSEVFGYEYTEVGDGENFAYSVFRLPGADGGVGGIFRDPEVGPADPAHWLVWFSISDTDAAALRAEELGARVVVPPTDSPNGRMAILTGPQGESFAIIDSSTATSS